MLSIILRLILFSFSPPSNDQVFSEKLSFIISPPLPERLNAEDKMELMEFWGQEKFTNHNEPVLSINENLPTPKAQQPFRSHL